MHILQFWEKYCKLATWIQKKISYQIFFFLEPSEMYARKIHQKWSKNNFWLRFWFGHLWGGGCALCKSFSRKCPNYPTSIIIRMSIVTIWIYTNASPRRFPFYLLLTLLLYFLLFFNLPRFSFYLFPGFLAIFILLS